MLEDLTERQMNLIRILMQEIDASSIGVVGRTMHFLSGRMELYFYENSTGKLPEGWDSVTDSDVEAFLEVGAFTQLSRSNADIEFRVNATKIRPTLKQGTTKMQEPIEIQANIALLRQDYPQPNRTGFIIMRFGTTSAHKGIVDAIKDTLRRKGLIGIRADDKQYHDELFSNVKTYMHGCGFGIAVFERIEQEAFNPNIALEVGYMLALGKPVCILKDKTITVLHADLIGRLYKEFDPQRPLSTIPPELERWLADKGLL